MRGFRFVGCLRDLGHENLDPRFFNLRYQAPDEINKKGIGDFPCVMSITVEVSLLSGKTATVQAGLDETVETLAQRAQIALGVGKGRLLDSSGVVLDGGAETAECQIRNGDVLTLHVKTVQIQCTQSSFAAILGDGSVVTWGAAGEGGDSSEVQEKLLGSC